VLKGWAVLLEQNVAANLNDIVGTHAEDVRVERSMVDRAHGHSVRDNGLAALRVLLDMRRVEKGRMPESTECALRLVRKQHSVAERTLMQAPLDDDFCVPPSWVERRCIHETSGPTNSHAFVQRHDELMLHRFLVNQPHRNQGAIEARGYPYEPYEWVTKLHGSPQRYVV